MVPADRKYTKEHVWFKNEGGVTKIGITDHAQEELGEILFAELPDVGSTYSVGDAIANVESAKTVSDIYTAVAGKVVEVNEDVATEPSRINEAPYDNYLVAVEVTETDEAQLMSAEEYEASLS